MSQPTTKLTDRRPDDDEIRASSVEQPDAQAEAESGVAVRVERFVSPCPPGAKQGSDHHGLQWSSYDRSNPRLTSPSHMPRFAQAIVMWPSRCFLSNRVPHRGHRVKSVLWTLMTLCGGKVVGSRGAGQVLPLAVRDCFGTRRGQSRWFALPAVCTLKMCFWSRSTRTIAPQWLHFAKGGL